MSSPRQQRGFAVESRVQRWLSQQGLIPVTQNFSCRTGEIDLIMLDTTGWQPSVLVFIEVRYRRSTRFGGAAASVTPRKQQRIVRAAKRFLQMHAMYKQYPCRFDVIAVKGEPDALEMSWLRRAFEC